jgi:hypothetical protein
MPVGLALLCALSAHVAAAENLWQSTFGQKWFFESRAWANQQLAGTWWESALSPGNTYQISFEVNHLKGVAGLFVGERKMITIDRKGWHAYDFKIWQGSERRMMFTTLRKDMTVGINNITVRRKWGDTSGSGSGGGGGSSWMPKGHYWSFATQRNLKTEMLDPVDRPGTAKSNWHLGIARDMLTALKTPGVKGFSMRINWGALEIGDGRYNWSLLDANMAAARRLGLKFVIQIGYRSFDGSNPLPGYFPGQYKVWTSGGGGSGVVAKLWEPWVYDRLIRLHKQIAWRYNGDAAFGGIASTETALGGNLGYSYSYWKYRTALSRIATETQGALKRGRYFWYLNFVRGGDSSDMRKDGRVSLVNDVPRHALAVGGPDITPDSAGMPGNSTSFRIHIRKTRPHVEQFCQAQHIDQGQGGVNRKSNQYRREFMERVKRVRERERQYWYKGDPAIFQFDDLRDPNGRKVDLHPRWVLGQLWNPWELFSFANRNFDCDYFFWHYRENVHNLGGQYWWYDIRPVILNNQYFFN